MTNSDHAREREMAIEIAKGLGMLRSLLITRGCFTMCDRMYKRRPAPSLFKAPGDSSGVNEATA